MKGLKERLLYFIEYKGLPVQMFEKIVGLSNAAVSKMGDNTRRSTIDKISKSFPELDVNWLLTGQGEMLYYGQDAESISNKVQEPTSHYGRKEHAESISNKVQEPTSHYGRKELNEGNGFTTYLLPMSAMGGTLTGFAAPGAMLQNCEAIISPIEDVDFAITVYGDSMAPEYPSGSRILIKKINPNIFIDWGKTYVLDTANGVIVKELHECKGKEGYVKCHSVNPDPKFSDFEVPLSEVYGVYRVLMCMSAK